MSKQMSAFWRAALAGGVLSLAALSAPAAYAVEIFVQGAPPAPRVEVMPGPRHGYVWANGYWFWDGRRHVWRGGHWERERVGHAWVHDHWEERGGRHYYVRGYWQ